MSRPLRPPLRGRCSANIYRNVCVCDLALDPFVSDVTSFRDLSPPVTQKYTSEMVERLWGDSYLAHFGGRTRLGSLTRAATPPTPSPPAVAARLGQTSEREAPCPRGSPSAFCRWLCCQRNPRELFEKTLQSFKRQICGFVRLWLP